MLANAGEKPPFVLVGHSFGGYNVRVFAHDHPDEVAGLVLVDSSHEEQSSRLPPAVLAASPGAFLFAFLEVAANLGVARVFPSLTNGDDRTGVTLPRRSARGARATGRLRFLAAIGVDRGR